MKSHLHINIAAILIVNTMSAFTPFADAKTILWQIGKADSSAAEFAFAPDKYKEAYEKRSPFFVVGASEPDNDWSYVQTGPLGWDWLKSGNPETRDIVFGLDKVEQPCRLLLDIVETGRFCPPHLRVTVNGRAWEFDTPPGGGGAPRLDQLSATVNRHRIVLDVPAESLRQGYNCISLSLTEGSWLIWDAIRFEAHSETCLKQLPFHTTILAVNPLPALIRNNGRIVQPVEVKVRRLGPSVNATLKAKTDAADEITVNLKPGDQVLTLHIPSLSKETELPIQLVADDGGVDEVRHLFTPVRKWEVHLIHQTHLDIGYTHTQEDVLKRQVGFLHQALDLIDKTKDYPEEARFRWHPEGMWAIDEFMSTASDSRKRQFIDAVRDGSIHLDAFYSHVLTGLANEEELFEMIQPAKEFERQYGVPVVSAIGSDVPGYTWGTVAAMAKQGVRYFNMAPNNNHRLGHLYHWADRPFYWATPSGKQKVLVWMASHSYIFFWGGQNMDRILSHLQSLEKRGFPYDIAMLRYEIGGDNGHPDPSLSDRIKAWNEKYISPRIFLSTNTRLFKTFEDRYGDKLPVVSGDLTPYWEDGATSTSADLAVSRRAGERLIQAQTLWAMLEPKLPLTKRFAAAWRKVIMYHEHTWGAHCSISQPFNAFTVSQEQYKQRFALDGAQLSETLIKDILSKRCNDEDSNTIDVYNTCSWNRGDLVYLTPEQSKAGDEVADDQGCVVLSQRLADSQLVFHARQVPAMGARRYTIRKNKSQGVSDIVAEGTTLSNKDITVQIDSQSGAIASLKLKPSGQELIDSEQALGLNDFLYILGRHPSEDRRYVQGPVKVTVEDAGPLVGTLCIETDAPGCNNLIRRVRLFSNDSRLELVNTVDKARQLEPEGVYFAFPLKVPDGQWRIDVPWAVVRPEKDQLIGANKNYYCVQRWMDISNNDMGLTWVTVDAPMVKFAPIEVIGQGRGDYYYMSDGGSEGVGVRDWWLRYARPGAMFYSWVMSNHWETNYKACQEGLITFKYVLKPHAGKYDPVKAQQFGRSVNQPLIAVCSDPDKPVAKSMFTLDNDGVVVTSVKPSRDGQGLMIRLFNTTDSRTNVSIDFPQVPKAIWLSNPMEDRISQIDAPIEMTKNEIVTLRVQLK